MLNKTVKNIISNYVGKAWSFISIYLFIPYYIKFLGIEAYGIINFYSVLLAIMIIADAGLSASLSREMAKSEDVKYQRNLVKTIEAIYVGISVAVFLVIFFFAKIIASKWLVTQNGITSDQLVFCIKLMGLTIAFQMLFVLYNSGLMGLQKQILSNNIQISLSFARSGLVLAFLYFIPKIEVYFIWQVLATVVFTILIRFQLWKAIADKTKAFFDKKILKSIQGFALGMMLMALISGVNSQIDKLLVSKLLSLSDFGYYSLAGVFGQISTILIMPITLAILPKMTKSVSVGDLNGQKEIFHLYSFLVSAIVAILGCVLILFTPAYLEFWLKNLDTVNKIDEVAKVLFLGGSFLALQFMPYYLAISHGHTRTNVRLGLLVIVLIIPILYFSINTYGLMGAAYPWLILNAFAFLYLGYFITRRFLKGEFLKWLFIDTGLPLLIALIVYFFVKELVIKQNRLDFLTTLLYSVLIGSALTIVYYYIFKKNYGSKR